MKKIYTLFLALLAIMVQAANYSGKVGENISWTLDSQGTLTISGTGSMEDADTSPYSWDEHYEQIKKVVVGEGITSIGTQAFVGYENLSSVTLPNSLDSICASAFASTAITSITLPSNLSFLGNGVFNNCKSLKTINLSSALTKIPYQFCANCSSLQTITLPENIIEIGGYAFFYCPFLSKITLGSSIRKIGVDAFYETALKDNPQNWKDNIFYLGQYCISGHDVSGAITIKDGTTLIAEDAFSDKKITSATLPNSLLYINESAFQYCSKLSTVSFNNSLLAIDDYAFGNSAIAEVQLPDALTHMGSSAFYYCEKLTSITFGKSLDTIPDGAFSRCSALTSVVIPDNVVSIKDDAFTDCASLADVTIGKNVVEMAMWYSFDQNAIKSLTWNAKEVQHINYNYTATVPNLETVTFGDEVEYIQEFLCSGATKLASVTLPKNLKEIDYFAFNGCTSLKKITIPNKVTKVDAAFSNCTALATVSVGAAVTDMDYSAFQNCPIKTLTWNAKHCSDGGFGNKPASLTKITFGKSVEYIPADLCNGASKLTSVTLPESLKEIGQFAFYKCTSLTEIVIPDNVTKIQNGAFGDCPALKAVTIGKALTDLESGAFDEAVLISITWNAVHCKDLDGDNFTNLETIVFGEGVEYIPGYICRESAKLKSVAFPSSLKEIGGSAFDECTGLTEVTIPANVTKINNGAFWGCENIKTVTCARSTPPTLGSSLYIHEDASLRVPCGSLSAYKKKSNWKNSFAHFEEYFPYTVSISSADETMGTTVMGDFDCSAGSVQIEAKPNTGFAFVSWSDGNTDASRTLQITSDTTLVASFKVQTFHIRFVDWDGTSLQESEVNYNTLPVAPKNPSRAATQQYTYTFKAWKPEIVAALSDATYKADYDSVLNEYRITFLNEDGSTIESKKWVYGQTPTCAEPTKESTDKFAYHFDGWNPEVAAVSGETTYQATFRAVPIHTLTFLDWNGDELGVIKAEEGVPAEAPTNPTRPGYEFAGWSRDLTMVNKDQFVIALYNVVKDGITVLYKDPADKLLSDEIVGFTLPVIPEEQHAGFLGWFVEPGNILDGIVVRAHFSNDPTDMPQNNASAPQIRKILLDGQVLIIREKKTYTLTGQEIK